MRELMTQFGEEWFSRKQEHEPSVVEVDLEIRKKVIVNRMGTDLCGWGAFVLVGREEPTPFPPPVF
jgi:hypothetical protein